MSPIHVIPINDIKPHLESINCWCVPKICTDESLVIVHNVFSEQYGDERDIN